MYSVKESLQMAGRYRKVKKILRKASEHKGKIINVHAFKDKKDITHWNVNGKDVRTEAKILLHLIKTNTDIRVISTIGFPSLRQYISSITNDRLLVYAMSIAQRVPSDDDYMDETRCYLILENMLSFHGQHDWIIPENWKKQKTNNISKEPVPC